MAANPRKRQKSLERRNAKRKEKKHALVREQSKGLPERLAEASRFPPLDAFVTENFWTHGIGWVLFSRSLPDGSVAVALFLVDRYCLGVKDALADVVSRFTYESDFLQKISSRMQPRELTPATARKLVESAVEYARGLGLAPHRDYYRAKPIFGDIDPTQSTEEFEFGMEGKPRFISGPNDTPHRCREILNALERTCGPGGFDFMMAASGHDMVLVREPQSGEPGPTGADGQPLLEGESLDEDEEE